MASPAAAAAVLLDRDDHRGGDDPSLLSLLLLGRSDEYGIPCSSIHHHHLHDGVGATTSSTIAPLRPIAMHTPQQTTPTVPPPLQRHSSESDLETLACSLASLSALCNTMTNTNRAASEEVLSVVSGPPSVASSSSSSPRLPSSCLSSSSSKTTEPHRGAAGGGRGGGGVIGGGEAAEDDGLLPAHVEEDEGGLLHASDEALPYVADDDLLVPRGGKGGGRRRRQQHRPTSSPHHHRHRLQDHPAPPHHHHHGNGGGGGALRHLLHTVRRPLGRNKTDSWARVSRSASLLLNQHSPSLTEMLYGDGSGVAADAVASHHHHHHHHHHPPLDLAAPLPAPRSPDCLRSDDNIVVPPRVSLPSPPPPPLPPRRKTERTDVVHERGSFDDGSVSSGGADAEELRRLRDEVRRLSGRVKELEEELDRERGRSCDGGGSIGRDGDLRGSRYKDDDGGVEAVGGGGDGQGNAASNGNGNDGANGNNSGDRNAAPPPPPLEPVVDLTPDHIERYSRQLLLADGFGVDGQKKLLSSSVLIVGAGGIGSTVLLYLAASGVGHLTIVDFDNVESSNLHRQVIHSDDAVGTNKAESARRAIQSLNPGVSCSIVTDPLTDENASDLVSMHDVVVDASDNPLTRYLLNDACVLAKKTLVSGSAMGTEGQLTVYRNDDYDSSGKDDDRATEGRRKKSCYRCLYPRPNATEGCKSCSDNGVLGTVPGLIGILQATEVVKILTGIGAAMHDRLLMYDSLRCSFLSIKKPPARKDCAVCGSDATIKTMRDSADVTAMARGPNIARDAASDVTRPLILRTDLSPDLNVSCQEYDRVRKAGTPHVLLDVRVSRQYDMCKLKGSVNIPLERLEEELGTVEELSAGAKPVYCLCRRGIASAEATRIVAEFTSKEKENGRLPTIHSVFNISGGLNAWVEQVDKSFPKY